MASAARASAGDGIKSESAATTPFCVRTPRVGGVSMTIQS